MIVKPQAIKISRRKKEVKILTQYELSNIIGTIEEYKFGGKNGMAVFVDDILDCIIDDIKRECNEKEQEVLVLNISNEQAKEISKVLAEGNFGSITPATPCPDWIECSKKMPPNKEDVLVLFNGAKKFITVSCFFEDEGVWYLSGVSFGKHAVSHWMPLPPLPYSTQDNIRQ